MLGQVEIAFAQNAGIVPSNRFDLAEGVQLDEAPSAVLTQIERTKTLLADRQCDEAIEILRRLADLSGDRLLGVTPYRFVGVRAWCQLQFAALPPEGLKVYRARVDPTARRWYEQGIAERDPKLLRNVVEHALASSFGDKALMALGEIAMESADYAAARSYWERILPAKAGSPPTWPGYPDTTLDLAAVRARLVLASILEGSLERARGELARFVRLHPDARGRLGEREGRLADLLASLLADAADWPTLAGDFERNSIASQLADVGVVAWRVPLRENVRPDESRQFVGEGSREPLSVFPARIGNLVLAADHGRILAVRLDTGKPPWGPSAVIHESQTDGLAVQAAPYDAIGAPRFTLAVFRDRLFARMGSPVTAQPPTSAPAARPGSLVAIDLNAEGRLLWQVEPDGDWAFEGPPVVDDRGVYVAMRRQDVRPQVAVACFEPGTGKLRWRRFVCGAETPARGVFPECTNNLLTLANETIYINTNLGAVAAIDSHDGSLLWVSLYPRARRGDLTRLAPHWRRGPNPCLWHRGTLFVAPADSPRVFAFDAAAGQMLWQTGGETDDSLDLLGVTGDWLIAGGQRLFWISLAEESRGRVKHVWPDGPERPGYGRGLLAASGTKPRPVVATPTATTGRGFFANGNVVLWCTRDRLYVFNAQTAEPRKVVDLAALGAGGGNLLVADGQLLIATDCELIMMGVNAK